MPHDSPALQRVLGFRQAYAVITGGIIGASILIVPSAIAARVPFSGGIVSVWIAGGLLTLCSALTLAELACMMPEAGGGYVYTRKAFGDFAGFLFSWTDAVIMRPGAATTVAFTAAIYGSRLVRAPAGLPDVLWQGVLTLGILALLYFVNARGAAFSGNVQFAGTAIKVAALLGASLLPYLVWHGVNSFTALPVWSSGSTVALLAAMVPVIWSFAGWDQLSHIAGELREPSRNIPLGFAAGVLTAMFLYIAVVIAIHTVLPLSAVVQSSAPGADLFQLMFGERSALLFSALLVLSGVVTANAAMLSASRSLFAVAARGDAPPIFARTEGSAKTPVKAVRAIALWSGALIVFSEFFLLVPPPGSLPAWMASGWGTLRKTPLFEILLTYVTFGYLAMCAVQFVIALYFRYRRPDWPRPYRTPLWPLTPLLSLAGTLALMTQMVITTPAEVIASVFAIALGIPAWGVVKRKNRESGR